MLDKIKQSLADVSALFWGLFARVLIFFGKPNMKKLVVYGGLAAVVVYFTAAAVLSAFNPPAIKVVMLLVACISCVVATRATWK